MNAVIVTGDRYADVKEWGATVEDALKQHRDRAGWLVIIQGGADGIDAIAGAISLDCFTYSDLPVFAQWGKHGKAAGPRRNTAMLSILRTLGEQGYAIAVLAFHNTIGESKGTKDMVTQAIRAGVPTWLYTTYAEPKRLDAAPVAAEEQG